jgi:hypothetical protein
MDDDHAPLLPTGTKRINNNNNNGNKNTNIIDGSRREKLLGTLLIPSSTQNSNNSSSNKSNLKISNQQQQQQELLMNKKNQPLSMEEELEEQNTILEEIHGSVVTVGELAKTLDNQLVGQNRLLMNIETDMNQTLSATESITRRTTKLVNASGGPRPFAIICFLSGLAFFLLLLIIYS